MAVKYFSVEESNALVPRLTEQMQSLQALQGAARGKYEEMRDIREVGYRKDGNLIMMTDYQVAKRELDEVVADANKILGAISELGCRVTDVEVGLIDFPALIDGEEVYLCWRMDEPVVGYFHGLDEGYAGRRPLPGK